MCTYKCGLLYRSIQLYPVSIWEVRAGVVCGPTAVTDIQVSLRHPRQAPLCDGKQLHSHCPTAASTTIIIIIASSSNLRQSRSSHRTL